MKKAILILTLVAGLPMLNVISNNVTVATVAAQQQQWFNTYNDACKGSVVAPYVCYWNGEPYKVRKSTATVKYYLVYPTSVGWYRKYLTQTQVQFMLLNGYLII